jgi:hypothetical protein
MAFFKKMDNGEDNNGNDSDQSKGKFPQKAKVT